MNPVIESARDEFRQRLDNAFAEHLQKLSWGNDYAQPDKANLKDPAQRSSFAASDPNKANYGPKVVGSPAWGAAQKANARPSTERQEHVNQDASVKAEL